jgi:hypothetical protein
MTAPICPVASYPPEPVELKGGGQIAAVSGTDEQTDKGNDDTADEPHQYHEHNSLAHCFPPVSLMNLASEKRRTGALTLEPDRRERSTGYGIRGTTGRMDVTQKDMDFVQLPDPRVRRSEI